MTLPWRNAWVIGASSGIGREVALRLARAGVTVIVSARSAEALARLAQEETKIEAVPLDIADKAAVASALDAIVGRHGAIDLVLIIAGVWHEMRLAEFDADRIAHAMAVNFVGQAFVIEAVLPSMRAAGRGHIALMSSVAGYRGLPGAIAYAPTKAAVISLAETLKPELDLCNIAISVINPGFVDTPMTRVNEFPMPFMIPAEEAARHIVRGLERKRFEIAFPWQLVTMLKIARILPYGLFFWITRRMLGARAK